MGETILKAIKTRLETSDPATGYTAAALSTLLNGGIWTRNVVAWKAGDDPAPGNTNAAYDAAGRIRRCLSVTASPVSTAYQSAPVGTYWEYPELYLRCLPHESEKTKAEQACAIIRRRLQGAVLQAPDGEGMVLTLAGQIGPFDDQIIQNAVLYMIRVQVDSIWK